ncbi:MAG: ACP phosphodiesterase [Bacteroidota bacterium]
MNFLAHAFLSGSNDDILIGNFIADAVKGNNANKFREGIHKGIILHREIDHFTDHHPVFIRSKNRIVEEYGKFAAVVIDIYYDHFLAVDWEKYADNDISEFAVHVYGLMLSNYSILPLKSRRILPFMIIHNWLVGYSRLKDLQWVFNGMSRRSRKYDSGMENAVESLKCDYENFKSDFGEFFPDMIKHASEFRTTL